MIYLDAPAGVGFSASNSSADDTASDKGLAADVVAFLLEWRKLYPALQGNPLWLAGESYASHYVPHITLRLLKHNEAAVEAERFDFRGFLLGNPSTDPLYDNEGRLTYWWSHGLISQNVKKEVEHSCDFEEVIITPDIEVKTRKESKACRKAVQDAISEMGPINIQNDALHANTSGELDWAYKGCTEGVTFKYSVDDQLDSMLPLHRQIMETAPKLHILIYTGDADGLVPLTGTRRWVFELGTEEGKKKKTHWRHWEDKRGQVGGYFEEYEGFTFATVRRAGHEAPYTAKERTFYVYKTWLSVRDIV
ncbi:serine carboxypeptidase-like 28 [Micractinium conductrix]|uniref:Carboxypeptidase n=1 Tax=Micractinium conductrix TaxID=554055 RepID=A0A2P6VNN7_9CHLO|nr:serine carboxypeptidase-like 28 [Micractinium conductrix]|eukprot:PSC75722.1 serine carboxypeptidase-like 28 [Micractinium conductrix]